MSSLQQVSLTSSPLASNHELNNDAAKLAEHEKVADSAKTNSTGYTILGDEANLPVASEILSAVSLDAAANPPTSPPALTSANASSPATKQLSQQERPRLVRLVKSMQSDTEIKKVCQKVLALHNNHPKQALDDLRELFQLAGRGVVSARVAEMLNREASNKNVDDIKAFGRTQTVEVASFLKRLPHTKEGAIDLTRMKKIGHGGTQDVYALPGTSSPFVIKVIRASLTMKPAERVEKYTTDKAAYQALRDGFGKHCTVEQLLLRTIDDGSANAEGVSKKQALISVAAFEEGYVNESKLGLNAPYFNWETANVIKNYKDHERFLKSLFVPGAEGDFDLQLLKTNLSHPGFVKMLELIEKDPGFRTALTLFLTEFKAYFNKTGQYLDISGIDNIIFFQTNRAVDPAPNKPGSNTEASNTVSHGTTPSHEPKREWVFRLGTVIKRETAQKFSEALEKMRVQANASDKQVSETSDQVPQKQDFDRATLDYCFHWTKIFNILGILVGMGRIIDDANVKAVASVWTELEKTGIMGNPPDPVQVLNALEIIETYPAEELAEKLQAIEIDLKKNVDILFGILSKLTLEKKTVVALYLHNHLPKAADPEPNYTFCPHRFHIGLELKDTPELKNDPASKALAIACFQDVLLDPNAPHAEVREAIAELSKASE